MQTVPGLVLCEKSEGTLIVFQQDAAGAQDIAHGGVIQIQLQQGADALQPVHQRIAVDEKLPGRGMEVLLLQQVDAQGVQQGGAVGLVVLLQAAQHGVDEGPEIGALGDGADKHVLIQGRGAAAARTAVQVPGGGGGFLIEAPHGAQLQQRGKRHAQDHGLVHAQAHLLQFLQQLFRLGSVPGAGQQKQKGGFGLHEPPFRPLVGQQSLLIRAGEPVRLRQRDAGQIEVRGRFQRRKAVQLFLHGALLGRLTEQKLLQKALFRCSPPGGGGCMHQIMLQQLQQTLGQDLVLRSKGVFQLNDLQPAAVAAIVGGDHRPHHPTDGAAVRLGVRYGLQAGKVAGRKIFDHGFGLLQVVMLRRFALQDAVPTVDADGLFRLHGQGGGVGLCNTKYVQSLVDEGKLPHMTDVVEHQNIWVQRCGSRVNEALVSMWFNNSPEAGNWLIDKCAEFGVVPVSFRAHAPNAIIPESYDYHMFVNVGDHQFDSKCGYFAATNVLYEDSQNAEKYEHPATYFFNTKAQELLVEDGRVTGVFAQRDGELWLFRATKGVILATGGIHEDTEMTDYYCDENIKRVQRCEHGPAGFSTGDGHKMGLWVGAHMQDGPFPLMLHPQACSMFHGCFPFVNQEGHRFMNEGTWVQGKSMNIMHQTGNVAWSIFDADYGKYNRMSLENGTGGGMFWDTMSAAIGQEFTDDDVTSIVESDIAVGNTVKADSIEELAALIGAPADVLKETIDRYNELVTKGADDDFHKPADFLYPVVKSPFYAAKVGVALLAVVGGLSVNTDLQVLDDEKKPIEGLYATGNTSGDLYAIDYPINMAGNSNGRCVIWGYLLGKTMAKATASGEALTSRDELADLAKDENGIVASDTVYKDGSYTGTGKGRGGDMEVTVTITDGKISDIVVNSHAESSDIGAPALDKLIQNAIAANSAEIDGASGATMTPDGFREAVAQALATAH